MAILNFFCLQCQRSFFGDVGKIDFMPVLTTEEGRPAFEKPIICPYCQRTLTFEKEEVELTELGQTQITDLELKFFQQHPPTQQL